MTGTSESDQAKEQRVYFGDEQVAPEEKRRRVLGVFRSVAGRYDLMNDLMSAGVHRLWKASFIDSLNPRPGMQILDVAGGTGDIAFRALRAAGGRARIHVLDINEAMLAVGRARARERGLAT
ncbi:MAG: methyltransferase domain-containing protein, partial [Alphaproteobacteria bacterium]